MTLGTVLLVLVFVVFLFMMMKKGGGCCGGHTPQEPKKGSDCCGMAVDKKSGLVSKHQGKHYAFCSEHCQKSFDADPDKYV